MEVSFTNAEQRWIDKKMFNWTIKEGCPASIREPLQRKLNLIYDDPQEDAFLRNLSVKV